MLLQQLCEYADQRMQLPPTLYSEGPVRYIVELSSDGTLLSPRPTDLSDPSSPRTKRGQRFPLPQIQRSVGIKPLLLADKADYVLGFGSDGAKGARVQACHSAFMEILDRCALETRESTLSAVQQFLHESPLSHLQLDDAFDPSGIMTFRVDGVMPIDLPSVRAFWASEHDPARGSEPVMQCLTCGQDRPVLDRLQAKIKGVPGGQTSGTSIISANADAFLSYGLTASLVAPTCAECGERFTKAANELLAGEASRIVMGGAAFIFWTREPVEFDYRTFLMEAKSEEVRSLMESLRTGRSASDVDETKFYATVLSGSGGRAVVRDWIDTTVGEAKAHLARWFERQAIVGTAGEDPVPLGLYALTAATVRDPQRELSPPTPKALIHCALTGVPVPPSMLFQAVRRNRAEQRVTRPRAALIKLVLSSQLPVSEEEADLVRLNLAHTSPGYHCGRLLAVLEDIQRRAIPGINATIVDRFFGAASSSPNSVFSRLVRGAQPHLSKLERDNHGAYVALQRRLQDIMANLEGFPRFLNLTEQGLFALGYYHQHAFDRGQAREAAERRRAGLPPAQDELPIVPDDDAMKAEGN